jgi:hypothetical protein
VILGTFNCNLTSPSGVIAQMRLMLFLSCYNKTHVVVHTIIDTALWYFNSYFMSQENVYDKLFQPLDYRPEIVQRDMN